VPFDVKLPYRVKRDFILPPSTTFLNCSQLICVISLLVKILP